MGMLDYYNEKYGGEKSFSNANNLGSNGGMLSYYNSIDEEKKKKLREQLATIKKTTVEKKQPTLWDNVVSSAKKAVGSIVSSAKALIPQLNNKAVPLTSVGKTEIKTPTGQLKQLDGGALQQADSAQLLKPLSINKNVENIIDSAIKFAQEPVDPTVNTLLKAIPGVSTAIDTVYKKGTQPLDVLKGVNDFIIKKIEKVNPTLAKVYTGGTFLMPGKFEYFIAKELEKAPKELETIWKDNRRSILEKTAQSAGQVVVPLAMYFAAPKIAEQFIPKTTQKKILEILGMESFNLLKLSTYKNLRPLVNVLARGASRGASTMVLINAAQVMKQGLDAGQSTEDILKAIITTSPENALYGGVFGTVAEGWGVARPKLFGYSKPGESVLTPEQAQAQVDGTNIGSKDPKLANMISTAATRAKAEGKNVKISVVAGFEGELTKKIGFEKTKAIGEVIGTGTTPKGIDVRVEIVDGPTPMQKLTGESPSSTSKQTGEVVNAELGITTLGKDTTVYRGAKDHKIDVTRPNGITGGVSFTIQRAVASRFADKEGGTVQPSQISSEAKVIDHSRLEEMVKEIPVKEKAQAVQKILKDNAIDVVRVDVPEGAQGEAELRVINPNVIKTIEQKTQFIVKDELKSLIPEVKKAKDVAEFVSNKIFTSALSGTQEKALQSLPGATISDKLESFYKQVIQNEPKQKIETKIPQKNETPKLKAADEFYISKIIDNVGKKRQFVQVEGNSIDLVKGIDTFIHKDGAKWVISEGISGLKIADGDTRAIAMAMAKRLLTEHANDMKVIINRAVGNAGAGMSPRYTSKEGKKKEVEKYNKAADYVKRKSIKFREPGAPASTPSQSLVGVKKEIKKTIIGQDPIINMKKDIQIKDVYGKIAILPKGEAYTPHLTSDNKILLKDGEQYLINKNQYQNVKGNALKAGVAKEFAPELNGLQEIIKGGKDREIKVIKSSNPKYDWDIIDANTKEVLDSRSGGFGYISDYINSYKKPTKYEQYTLPGGTSYQEILIQAPIEKINIPDIDWIKEKNGDFNATVNGKNLTITPEGSKFYVYEKNGLLGRTVDSLEEAKKVALDYANKNISKPAGFQSAHWNEKNVISHIRTNERITPNGEKVLFLEELQSDWAREARSKGFTKPANNRVIELRKAEETRRLTDDELDELFQMSAQGIDTLAYGSKPGVPFSPLLKNWQELSIKRALQEAVNSEAKYFSWTTGEQQQDRYQLSKQVKDIKWEPGAIESTGTELSQNKLIIITPKNQGAIMVTVNEQGIIIRKNTQAAGNWIGQKLDEVVGKGLAEKIMAEPKGLLEGNGLNIGGRWANKLYDEQVPNIVKDLVGGNIETIKLETGEVMATYEDLPPALQKLVDDFDAERISRDVLIEEAKKSGFEFDFEMGGEINSITNLNVIKSQQAIKITPEIKAIIKGEAPPLKQPSGIEPKYRIMDDFKRITGLDITEKQEKEILDLNKKLFGDEKIKITEQILSNENALGKYEDGMVEIVKGKGDIKDTFLHEAVHKYLDVFSTEQEHIDILMEASEIYGIDDFTKVEEKLAEDFIKYAKDKEDPSIFARIREFFNRLMSRIKAYFGNRDRINTLYDNILKGNKPKPTEGQQAPMIFDSLKGPRINKGRTTSQPIKILKPEQAKRIMKRVTKLLDEGMRIAEEQAANNKRIEEQLAPFSGDQLKDIASLKRMAASKAGQEGDIETLYNKNAELTSRVVNSVLIAKRAYDLDLEMTDEQAIKYALSLPSKSEIRKTAPDELRKAKKLLKDNGIRLAEDNTTPMTYEEFEAQFKEANDAMIAEQGEIGFLMEDVKTVFDGLEELKKLEVPQEKLPVGTGVSKESRAYKRVRSRLAEEVQQDVNYNPLNLEQDTQNALDFITSNPEAALRVGLGLEAPPAGQTETAISIALADKAGRDGDYALQSQLEASRSLRQTRRGQEIVSERGRFDETSPHVYIREIMDRRLNNLGSNLKRALVNIGEKTKTAKQHAVDAIDRGVEKLKAKIAKDRSKIKMAQDIIDSLAC